MGQSLIDHIISAVIALAILVPMGILFVVHQAAPAELVALAAGIIGYYFGTRVNAGGDNNRG